MRSFVTGIPRSMLLIVPTTPTMRMLGLVAPPRWISWPMALRPLKYFSTMYWSTIATGALVGGIAVVEQAALDQRDLHRLEVIGADDLLPRVRARLPGPGRVADDRVGAGADVAVERHVRRQADAGRRRGSAAPSRPGAARTPSAVGGVRITRGRQRDLRRQHVLAVEARIDTAAGCAKLLISSPAPTSSMSATAVSPTTSAARRSPGAAAGRSARRIFLQHRRRVAADDRDRRHDAEDQAGHHGERAA